MSADLYLRVVQPELVERVTAFLVNDQVREAQGKEQDDWYELSDNNLWNHPQVDALWVGAVSWLKAELLEDDRYVPGPVVGMQRLWGTPAEVTPLRIKSSMDALNFPNTSIYGRVEHIYDKEGIEANWGMGMGRRRYHYRSDTGSGPRRVRFPNGQRMITYRTRGTQRPRVVKRWLERHDGEFVVVTSD